LIKRATRKLKSFWTNWEKKEILHEQEDLLILDKERNLALEKFLAEEKAKVEKLTTDLSLANDSNKRMSKDYTLANESLASLKATHSEFQSSLSCLMENTKLLKLTLVVFEKAPKPLLLQDWTLVPPLAKVVLFALTLI
jgi:septal ring factor EnvC (AmiA/AmiB activator)